MYRCINNLLPEDIFDNYINPISHCYNTRSKANKKLYIRKINTNYGKFYIKYSVAKVWNDIPLVIRNSSSLSIFKIEFKKYIISSENCLHIKFMFIYIIKCIYVCEYYSFPFCYLSL